MPTASPTFAIRPPGRRPVYYVTTLSYPRIPSSSSLGTDARAIPSILATLERARDTGETTMSNQTTLPGDIDLPADRRPVAFELFVPVYGGEELGSDASVAQRRRQFVGWATGQFRVGDFLDAAMTTAPPFTGVELHDEDVGGDSLVASYPRGFRAAGPYVREKKFTLGGRNFLLRYAPLPGNAVLTERTIPASLVLAMGVAASVLLGALLWLLAQVGALYREVGRLARTDSLTGVANRRAWDEELPRELARAARSGQAVCVALLDLDHFKDYNDEHGHQAGDRLLKAASAAWEGRLRKTDLLARYGGEEFAVLLPDCQLGNAMEIAERLRTAQPEGTCSIGVADWDGRQDEDELIARADRALYAAKAGGRNQCRADTAPRPAAASLARPVAAGGVSAALTHPGPVPGPPVGEANPAAEVDALGCPQPYLRVSRPPRRRLESRWWVALTWGFFWLPGSWPGSPARSPVWRRWCRTRRCWRWGCPR